MMTRRSFVGSLAWSALGAGGPRSVRVDSDGMLRIDGRREFILGLYDLPKMPDAWVQVRDVGFNLVHLKAKREDLVSARQQGLYGWVTLGSISPLRRAADEERIRKIVAALKDEPALLFWETVDEPAWQWKKPGPRVSPEQIIATRRFVEGLDPAHPFYLNHAPTNLVETLRRYNAGADIVAVDIYPVIPAGIRELFALWPDGRQGDLLNTSISQVGQYADKMRAVAGPSRALFLVLQAFAWENLREKDRDPKMVLYPDRHQLRFMAWQSVVHGANGLLFWGLAYTPPDAPLWTDLKSVASELVRLRTELASRTTPLSVRLGYHDTGHSVDRGIEWIAKPSQGGVVLLAVNADPNPVEVEFSGLGAFRNCETLFDSRGAKLIRGGFRSSFDPFDARAYRLTH